MSARKLRQFRREFERQANKPASEIEVPLLHVLHDICVVLGLSKADRQRVIGKRSQRLIDGYQQTRLGSEE